VKRPLRDCDRRHDPHLSDWEEIAAMNLKKLNPNSEITLRDLQTGTVTVIEHPSSR
jgi:hypothetical protein